MVSFVVQKLVSLIRSHLFIFAFIFITLRRGCGGRRSGSCRRSSGGRTRRRRGGRGGGGRGGVVLVRIRRCRLASHQHQHRQTEQRYQNFFHFDSSFVDCCRRPFSLF